MRNMSFTLTTRQVREQSKTHTRRLGWAFLKSGDVVMAVEKGQGLKKGDRVTRLGRIEIVSIRHERLDRITQEDVAREGFPELTPAAFVDMFARANMCWVGVMVAVIEFRYLDPPGVVVDSAANANQQHGGGKNSEAGKVVSMRGTLPGLSRPCLSGGS